MILLEDPDGGRVLVEGKKPDKSFFIAPVIGCISKEHDL